MKKMIFALVAMFVCVINVNAASANMEEIRALAYKFLVQKDINELDKVDSLTNALLEERELVKKNEAEGNFEEAFKLQTSCNQNLDTIIQILDELHAEASKASAELQLSQNEECYSLKAKVVVFSEYIYYITDKICKR